MERIKAFFSHNGTDYHLWINPLSKEPMPTVFQVFDDQGYFKGQLIYYGKEDAWHFHNNPDIAAILAELVMLWYQ